jgi:hypothetical protein
MISNQFFMVCDAVCFCVYVCRFFSKGNKAEQITFKIHVLCKHIYPEKNQKYFSESITQGVNIVYKINPKCIHFDSTFPVDSSPCTVLSFIVSLVPPHGRL